MAVNNLVHVNENGLPLNAVEWLENHHRSKAFERRCMIRDLQLKKCKLLVDAGCGPGMWTPLLAEAISSDGQIIGIDISAETLITAQRRCANAWYREQVSYKRATLEQMPIDERSADVIFSANVGQYLADPVRTFAAMGPYLAPGGRLVVKDIDFGTMRFSNIDPGLQARVFQARERWEQERIHQGFPFEDSWVGSKLAGYLREAGYQQVQESAYRIVRNYPLPINFIHYLQGIAEWFVCEGAPFLSDQDVNNWIQCFFSQRENVLEQKAFLFEETEFVVTGVWNPSSEMYCMHTDTKLSLAESVASTPLD